MKWLNQIHKDFGHGVGNFPKKRNKTDEPIRVINKSKRFYKNLNYRKVIVFI